MRLIITLFTSLVLLIPAIAQGQWEIINECFPRMTINTIDFIDDETGWIAGIVRPAERVSLYLTTNGCRNWKLLNDSVNFQRIDFHDESIGWAVAGGDSIMKTSDGGRNWILQMKVNDSIQGFYTITASTAYAIGDTVYKTADGGSTWVNITPSLFSNFSAASFINADTGVVICNGNTIHRTFDGGETWNSVELSEFSNISNLQYINESTGYFLARKWNDSINHYICKTIDYFNEWIVLSETSLPIQLCHFFDNETILVGSQVIENYYPTGDAYLMARTL